MARERFGWTMFSCCAKKARIRLGNVLNCWTFPFAADLACCLYYGVGLTSTFFLQVLPVRVIFLGTECAQDLPEPFFCAMIQSRNIFGKIAASLQIIIVALFSASFRFTREQVWWDRTTAVTRPKGSLSLMTLWFYDYDSMTMIIINSHNNDFNNVCLIEMLSSQPTLLLLGQLVNFFCFVEQLAATVTDMWLPWAQQHLSTLNPSMVLVILVQQKFERQLGTR